MSDEPNVRMIRPSDINDILSLDVKCYHYPLEMAEWTALINGKKTDDEDAPKSEASRVAVVEVYRKKVGYVVMRRLDDDVMMIERLGVRTSFRRQGLGMMLVHEANATARNMRVDVVRIVVPAIHCQPPEEADADDVSGFLNKAGFKPTGKIVPDFVVMYGNSEDGYVWERKVV